MTETTSYVTISAEPLKAVTRAIVTAPVRARVRPIWSPIT